MTSISALGICASPRSGNSEYLLRSAFSEARKLPFNVNTNIIGLRGKKIQPCIACFKCLENKGVCILEDDFEEVRSAWLDADVVIYSVPVYHLSIPGQLKCFIDRLGQSLNGYYDVRSVRHLKVVGNISQGTHLFGGQEIAIANLILHEVLTNCVPIAGDGWESYIGVAGWTSNQRERKAFKELHESNDHDASITIRAASSMMQRAIETAAIIKMGGLTLSDSLKGDPRYKPFLERIAKE